MEKYAIFPNNVHISAAPVGHRMAKFDDGFHLPVHRAWKVVIAPLSPAVFPISYLLRCFYFYMGTDLDAEKLPEKIARCLAPRKFGFDPKI